ncbi:MAG: aldose 1-epimerase family protein [Devosia sp.]
MELIAIGNEQVRVTISPLGAEMQSIVTSDGQSWLWDGDEAFWNGRSPVLFPVVGKSPHDHISLDGQSYPMSQHGFARRSDFALVESGEDFCRFELKASQSSRTIYPFDFTLSLEHRVVRRAVVVTAEVHNSGHHPMPFGIGFHPAFVWPLPGSEGQAHRVVLDNGGSPELIRLSGGLVNPAPLPSPFVDGALTLDGQLFAADAMLFPDGAGAGLRYGTAEKAIHFTWENLPNLALWSKPGAPFVCLEPWHGTAAEVGGSDDLAERPYAEVLGPGATGRYGFKVELIG